MDIYSDRAGETGEPKPGSVLDRFVAKHLQHALSGLDAAHLVVELPSGYRVSCGDPAAGAVAEWRIYRWNALLRLGASGALGFAEGYVNGDWETPDLRALLDVLARAFDQIDIAQAQAGPSRIIGQIQHWLNANTRTGSRRNIAFHYDLGNSFYALWLDQSMTYSSACFTVPEQSLEAAQAEKYRRICVAAQLKPGDHVLEIGCGWGGFAEVAARDFGCRVTGVTLSSEQLTYAQNRIAEAGLTGQVELQLRDYRDIDQRFDAIVSIEMFEAVGQAHWPIYFDQLVDCLKPGGHAALQIITLREEDFESYRGTVDFIQKYVFPGGMLPPPSALTDQAERSGLEVVGATMFGGDYAETLHRWHSRFNDAWPQIGELGFDERFARIWRYYLAYCEAGFRSGRCDAGQFVYRRPVTATS
ncbi:cyclopropane-fatty-acyl-phospholipid synthase family protein [uncultured Maricaulis sp.]|uniref:cyclopropane-fatty-acyl-phospholipid synthase family protein n=1 Tax=uncultured Maricaulis sp. TaxID=174710 RepID=UPI0030DAC885